MLNQKTGHCFKFSRDAQPDQLCDYYEVKKPKRQKNRCINCKHYRKYNEECRKEDR